MKYVILAIAGIAFLYGVSQLYSPPHVDLSNIWKYEGKEIITEGKIINKIGSMFEIRNGNYTCYVYSWKKDFSYGDFVKIRGNVGEKNGMLVIYANEIKLLKKWDGETLTLPYLAENFIDYIDCNVSIVGHVYASYTDYFYLIDEYNEYRIKVYYENSSFEKFQKVVVKGRLRYNSHRMEFYIEGANVE
ncbi:MAG: OB-fold nucleic acid binding domain-containing protein [Thermoplasmata archaeon]|nr:OB-fold nucleic acid binding domain-containing protein [Thermoplasmata archaeon]